MTYAGGKQEEGVNESLPDRCEPSPSGGLAFDPAEFLHYVEDFDLTESEALELIRYLYGLMYDFARIGFGLDPVQQIVGSFVKSASAQAVNEVKSKLISKRTEFEEAAMPLAAMDSEDA